MKIAVLADIHSNFAALEAAAADVEAWRPDQVIVAGDVVNRGPRPAECLAFVLERQAAAGWLLVRGNHEDYVLYHARPEAPRQGPRFELRRDSYWTYCRLDGRVEALAAMPFQVSLAGPGGGELRAVHASMRHNRDSIFPDTPHAELRPRIAPAPAVLCVGHTHIPFVERVDDTLLVNVGSAGLPFDRDWRAAYARLTWDRSGPQAEIHRLEYDRQRAERDYIASGFLDRAGPLARLMRLELRQARSHLHQWARRFEAAVLADEIRLAAAVDEYLAGLD
ncbi:MAG: metallophosphoesterase family protein [Candidatus Promineifilaceae bacterium]